MTQALSKYRICDFTGQLAGAGATKWLGVFGAEIIRIEDPVREGRWDILRGANPFVDERRGINLGGAFNNHNVNKYGITLNLRKPKAKEMLKEIIRQSDVVSENFSAGVLKKWGFGYDELKAIKPDIIYVSNCGFGHTGPYHEYRTWGPIVQAISGLTFTSALPNQQSAGWGYSYMDHTGGYYMAMAIMLALLHREQTGEGQWVDLSCTEAAVTLNGPALLDWSVNRKSVRETGVNANRSQFIPMAPHGIYPCSGDDHWIAISCRTDVDWQQLASLIDATWTRGFDKEDSRLENQDELDQQLGSWTREWNKFELQDALRERGVPAAAVQKPSERIEEDPTTHAWGLWPSVDHTEIGKVRVDGQPVHFSKTDWQVTKAGPCLGEDNIEVFGRLLDMAKDEVQQLQEEGVI